MLFGHCCITWLTIFGHIMRMDDNADAKRILLASPLADWRRQLGRPHITWLSTVQQDLKQHHFMLPEAADLAQNRPLWRMMSTYGATQSWVACQKRRRRMPLCVRWGLGNHRTGGGRKTPELMGPENPRSKKQRPKLDVVVTGVVANACTLCY